jgi:hypothetical protein
MYSITHFTSRFFGVMAAGAFVGLPLLASAEAPSHVHQVAAQQTPGWVEQLKGQTVIEDAMAGRPDRATLVERQHQRIMFQMEQDAQSQHTGGLYNNMSMMHQYGAGGQDLLLVSDPRNEPVAAQGG